MATIDQLSAALVKADAAGDVEGARMLAGEIRKMRESPKEEKSMIGALGGAIGQGVGNVALGAQNLVGMGLEKLGADQVGQWMQKDAAQGKAKLQGEIQPYEEQYPITVAGGRLGGEIAGTLPVGGVLAKGVGALAKGAGAAKSASPLVEALRTGGMSVGGQTGTKALATRVAGGAATGGGAGALASGDMEGGVTGAIVGGAFPVGVKLAGEGGKLLGKMLRPSDEVAAVAQKAQKYGIPLGLGDISENKMVQATRSILKDAPLTGGMAQGAQEAKQEAFNKAVGATFGASEKKLTLPVLDAAQKRMGAEFDRIWGGNSINVDPTLIKKMSDLDEVAKKLPANEGASLQKEIQDIYSRMIPDANGNMQIPGDVANKFQQYLRRRAEGSSGLRNELGDLRQALIQSFNRSVDPADAAALTLTREQYKAFKTVEPMLRSAELGVAGRAAGDVPAALLPNAVNKSYSNLDSDLANLAQVGSKFLVDRTAQTGGSARAALQNTALGGALATGAITNPWTLAAVPSAIGVQKLLQSPGAANALLGKGQVSPKLIQALRAAQISAPVISAQ